MKKRLRKKLGLGEYADMIFEVKIHLNGQSTFDEFFNSFGSDAVGAIGGQFGGGYEDNCLEGGVVVGRLDQDAAGKLEQTKAWLGSRSDVASFEIGPLEDVPSTIVREWGLRIGRR